MIAAGKYLISYSGMSSSHSTMEPRVRSTLSQGMSTAMLLPSAGWLREAGLVSTSAAAAVGAACADAAKRAVGCGGDEVSELHFWSVEGLVMRKMDG